MVIRGNFHIILYLAVARTCSPDIAIATQMALPLTDTVLKGCKTLTLGLFLGLGAKLQEHRKGTWEGLWRAG